MGRKKPYALSPSGYTHSKEEAKTTVKELNKLFPGSSFIFKRSKKHAKSGITGKTIYQIFREWRI